MHSPLKNVTTSELCTYLVYMPTCSNLIKTKACVHHIYFEKKNFAKILHEPSWNEHALTTKYVLICMNMSIQDSLFDASYYFEVMIAIADIFCKDS